MRCRVQPEREDGHELRRYGGHHQYSRQQMSWQFVEEEN